MNEKMKNIEELRISHKDIHLIHTEFEQNKPYEACGVLIGTIHQNTANVEKIIPITNIKRTRVSFELDPMQLYNVWNDADKNGKEIVGIFHTHPSHSAFPSSWDRETMKDTRLVWLITGIDGTRAYILDCTNNINNGIRPVRLEII